MSEDIPVYAAPPIKGYRKLTASEVDDVNIMKGIEETVLELLTQMQGGSGSYDQRWVAIAKTDIQKAFMSVNRAILRPADG